MKWPGFIGGSFQPQAAIADNSRTVNFYVEPSQGEGAVTPAALYPSPGFVRLSNAVAGTPRAHFFQHGREFAVVDGTLWEFDLAGAGTNRGAVANDTFPATITSNGDINNQLFITAGRNAYIFNLTANTLTQIAALDGLASQGDFLDGYFLCLNHLTSTLYISALGDGLVWTTGTDFAQRSLQGDPWRAMKVCGRFVWLFGEQTTEVWYNTADTFPFAPHPSGLLNYGIRAAWSPRVIGSTILWLGETASGRRSVMRANGFTPEIISPYALDLALSKLVGNELAYADVITLAGHTFYVLGINQSNITWVWDATTQTWVEWMAWNKTVGQETAWRGRFFAQAFNQPRIFDRVTGFLYKLTIEDTLEVEDANLDQIRRLRRCPAPYQENKRIFYKSLTLDVEGGLGQIPLPLNVFPPLVMLRVSNNAGKSFPVERWQSAGALGEYNTRLEWTRLGSARRRVFEMVMSDRAIWHINGAYLDAEVESA